MVIRKDGDQKVQNIAEGATLDENSPAYRRDIRSRDDHLAVRRTFLRDRPARLPAGQIHFILSFLLDQLGDLLEVLPQALIDGGRAELKLRA